MKSVKTTDVLCISIVAEGSYAGLAFQALSLPPGYTLDALVFGPEFRTTQKGNFETEEAFSNRALVLLCLASVPHARDDCGVGDPLENVIPLRWAELIDKPQTGTFLVRLGLTFGSQMNQEGESFSFDEVRTNLINSFSVKSEDWRKEILIERGLHPNHPVLISKVPRELLIAGLPDCSKIPARILHIANWQSRYRRRIPGTVLMEDARRWETVSREIFNADRPIHFRNWYPESSLRIIAIERQRSLGVRRFKSYWKPSRQRISGRGYIYHLTRRRPHQLNLVTRLQGTSEEIDGPVTFELNLFRELGSTRTTPIQITSGTLGHHIPILAADSTHLGELSIDLKSKARSSYIAVAVTVGGLLLATPVMLGVATLAAGIAVGSWALFATSLHSRQAFGVASVVALSVGVAFLTYGLARWARN